MSFDIETLVKPLSGDRPCGENLEYDAAYSHMERLLDPQESNMTSQEEDGQPPGIDWRALGKVTAELSERTRDVRVQVYATIASLHTEGLEAFRDGLTVLRAYLENFWEDVHPQLDPEDGYDPTARMWAIQALNKPHFVLLPLERMKLVRLKGVGEYSMAEILVANDPPDNPGEDVEIIDPNFIREAFRESAGPRLEELKGAVRDSIGSLQAIRETWTEKTADLEDKQAKVVDIEDAIKKLEIMAQMLDRNSPAEGSEPEASEGKAGDEYVAPTPTASPGVIGGRADVVRALERICDYYEKNEPASPVPLLLKRAQRLVDMSFMEILEDMVPDGVNQARLVGGIKED